MEKKKRRSLFLYSGEVYFRNVGRAAVKLTAYHEKQAKALIIIEGKRLFEIPESFRPTIHNLTVNRIKGKNETKTTRPTILASTKL